MGEPEAEKDVFNDQVVALLWALRETHRHIEALLEVERISASTIKRAMTRGDDVMEVLLERVEAQDR